MVPRMLRQGRAVPGLARRHAQFVAQPVPQLPFGIARLFESVVVIRVDGVDGVQIDGIGQQRFRQPVLKAPRLFVLRIVVQRRQGAKAMS